MTCGEGTPEKNMIQMELKKRHGMDRTPVKSKARYRWYLNNGHLNSRHILIADISKN